jgi:hypothetical protein
MVDSRLELKDIEKHVVGIFFFGTPHKGSDLAGWASVLNNITKAFLPRSNASVALSLKSIPERLSYLDEAFFTVLRNRREKSEPIQIVTFYEQVPVPVVGIVWLSIHAANSLR